MHAPHWPQGVLLHPECEPGELAEMQIPVWEVRGGPGALHGQALMPCWCWWPLWLPRLSEIPRVGKTQPPPTGWSQPLEDPVYWDFEHGVKPAPGDKVNGRPGPAVCQPPASNLFVAHLQFVSHIYILVQCSQSPGELDTVTSYFIFTDDQKEAQMG